MFVDKLETTQAEAEQIKQVLLTNIMEQDSLKPAKVVFWKHLWQNSEQDKDARLKNVTVGKYSYGTQDTIVVYRLREKNPSNLLVAPENMKDQLPITLIVLEKVTNILWKTEFVALRKL